MSSSRHTTPTPAFVPSPPLSASPGLDAPDCPHDDIDTLQEQGDDRRRRFTPKYQPRTDSSPCSLVSSAVSRTPFVPSVISSFTSDCKQDDTDIDAVRSAIRLISASKEGALPRIESPDWHELTVSPAQFLDLRRQLEKEDLLDYFENWLRWDYSPGRGVLVLRLMATALHESLQDSLFFHIRKQLDDHLAGAEPALADAISKIRSCGHAKVRLGYTQGALAKKSPDSQLRFTGRATPQFVVEVGYSQKAESLQELAKEYYEESDGEIKTVLTLNIEYGSPGQRNATVDHHDRTAVFCLYRGPKRVHKDTAFRDADGAPVAGVCLRLFLSDFIPDDMLRDLPAALRRKARATAINLPAQLLCSFLTRAELDQKAEDDDIERFEKRLREAGPPSKKRKSVHWDLDAADDHDPSEAASSRSSSESSPRSKKRRTDLEYRPRSRSSRSASIEAGGEPPRRTRSITRSSNEGSRPPGRARSNTAQSDDDTTRPRSRSRRTRLIAAQSDEDPVGRLSRPRTRSIARSEDGAV